MAPFGAAQAEDGDIRRFLIVVGHNSALDASIAPLRYADDDAGRTYELLARGAERATLLTTFDAESQELFPHLVPISREPTRRNLLGALEDTYEAIESAQADGHETVLHVFFSGHGQTRDATGSHAYLNLADGAWTRSDMLDEIVRPQVAGFTHLVIDACNAFFMVHGRGWSDDAEADPAYADSVEEYLSSATAVRQYPRVGLFLSTTGEAEVHEWGQYQAGVFSHQFRSAIVGAADVNGDGGLTYDEIAAYIAAANAAVTTPDARLSVYASPPEQNRAVSFLDVGAVATATLLIEAGAPDRLSLSDERGNPYAEITTAGDRAVEIALASGGRADSGYLVSRGNQEAWVDVSDGSQIRLDDLDWAESSSGGRGTVDREFRANLFAVHFGQGFYQGFLAGQRDVDLAEQGETVVSRPLDWTLNLNLGTASPLRAAYGGWEQRAAIEATIGGQARRPHGLIEIDFGSSTGRDDRRIRRAALVGGIGYSLPLAPGLSWRNQIAAGPQFVGLRTQSGASVDRVGLRAIAETGLAYGISRHFEIGLDVSGSLSFLSDMVEPGDGEGPLLTEDMLTQIAPGISLRFVP
ncbi:MAG: hypothetical protein ACJAYU_003410 [Bradymonadia bacterium]|jgi:hypothetical protein